jgi:thiamine kinase-like enzyme
VRGAPYLLRATGGAEVRGDPARQYTYAKAAADAGIAPRVLYSSVEDRILITDFVEPRPFPDDMARRLAPLIRRVQSLPGWPAKAGYFETIQRFVGRFRAAKLLPDTLTEELCGRYAAVTRVYPRRVTDLVVTHNDLKADNMLFDGERVWLVDWESAFLNDRYVDLAVAANFFARDEPEEGALLTTYFERPATEYEEARFYLMRQIVHTFAAAFCMLIAAAAGERVDPEAPAENFDEFHRRMITGEVNLASSAAQMRYAKVHLDRAIGNGRTRRFEDALVVVSDGDARS